MCLNSVIKCWYVSPPLSLYAGQYFGPAVGCRGIRGVLFQGVGEQRAGRFPCDHTGVGQPHAQTPQTQQLEAGAEASHGDTWTD